MNSLGRTNPPNLSWRSCPIARRSRLDRARPLGSTPHRRAGGVPVSTVQRRQMVISPLWLQGVILTFVFGFAVLGYLALRVYEDHAPVPVRVVSEAGQPLFTGEDVLHGQEAFLTY